MAIKNFDIIPDFALKFGVNKNGWRTVKIKLWFKIAIFIKKLRRYNMDGD